MTGQLSPLAQGKAAGTTGYTSKVLKTGQTTQYDSELDDGYYEVGVAKSYTINTSGAQSGTTNVDVPNLISTTGAFTASDKKYTDAGKCGVLAYSGYNPDTWVITGSASNNGTFTSTVSDANSITFAQTIVNEDSDQEITFSRRAAISNNTVLDNNTGLEWLRYPAPARTGYAGTGRAPWSGSLWDIFAFCAACNTASVGGYNDWRIPNAAELFSLLDTAGATWLDSTAFPTVPLYVWSSSTYRSATSRALLMQYDTRTFGGFPKTEAYKCMLVRGGTA